MSLLAILLTASLTVVSGVTVFVVGQLLSRLCLDPLERYRAILSEVHQVPVTALHTMNDVKRARDPEARSGVYSELRKLHELAQEVDVRRLQTIGLGHDVWVDFGLVPRRCQVALATEILRQMPLVATSDEEEAGVLASAGLAQHHLTCRASIPRGLVAVAARAWAWISRVARRAAGSLASRLR